MDLIEVEKKIIPEMFELMEIRYNILRSIYYNQPIGRRGLAQQLNIGERAVRTEVNILKEQGLLTIESMGMYITEDGKRIIKELKDLIESLKLTNRDIDKSIFKAAENVELDSILGWKKDGESHSYLDFYDM